MPNWTRNRIVAMGTELQIHNFIKRTTSRIANKRTFDFEKIIPSPDVYKYDLRSNEQRIVRVCAYGLMLDITNHNDKPGYNDLITYAANYLNCAPKDFVVPKREYNKQVAHHVGLSDAVTGKVIINTVDDVRKIGVQLLRAYHQYNTRDWYEWCCKYWGTKWNPTDTLTELAYNSNDLTAKTMTVSITFDTAWCAPMPIFNQLFKDYPELQFDVVYADEEIGRGVGGITVHNKYRTYSHYDDDSNDAMCQAISLWEMWDDYEYDREIEQWVYVGDYK